MDEQVPFRSKKSLIKKWHANPTASLVNHFHLDLIKNTIDYSTFFFFLSEGRFWQKSSAICGLKEDTNERLLYILHTALMSF